MKLSISIQVDQSVNGKSSFINDLSVDAVVVFQKNEDDPPDVFYNRIMWGSTNIFPLLDNVPGGDDILQWVTGMIISAAKERRKISGLRTVLPDTLFQTFESWISYIRKLYQTKPTLAE